MSEKATAGQGAVRECFNCEHCKTRIFIKTALSDYPHEYKIQNSQKKIKTRILPEKSEFIDVLEARCDKVNWVDKDGDEKKIKPYKQMFFSSKATQGYAKTCQDFSPMFTEEDLK